MRLYKITASRPEEQPVVQYVGTQADASRVRKELVSDQGFKRAEVETEEVEVPTNKAGLLEFLNDCGHLKA